MEEYDDLAKGADGRWNTRPQSQHVEDLPAGVVQLLADAPALGNVEQLPQQNTVRDRTTHTVAKLGRLVQSNSVRGRGHWQMHPFAQAQRVEKSNRKITPRSRRMHAVGGDHRQ